MHCNLIKSDRIHRNGKPYWICSRSGCNNKCVSDNGRCNVGQCKHPSITIPLGDIAETLINAATLGNGKKIMKMITGKDCNCDKRKKKMNELGTIPLPSFMVKDK